MDKLEVLKELIMDALNVGVFPEAVICGDKKELRTPYQDGWNAAIIKITEQVGKAIEKLDTISEDAAFLITHGCCIFNNKLLLNLNDIFYFASADSEEVAPDDIPELVRLIKTYGYTGGIYWAGKKRNEVPTIEKYAVIFEEIRNKECLK